MVRYGTRVFGPQKGGETGEGAGLPVFSGWPGTGFEWTDSFRAAGLLHPGDAGACREKFAKDANPAHKASVPPDVAIARTESSVP